MICAVCNGRIWPTCHLHETHERGCPNWGHPGLIVDCTCNLPVHPGCCPEPCCIDEPEPTR